MDVYNDGERIVGPDRAISQNPDRLRAKRTLDVDLARRDVGQGLVSERSSVTRAHRRGAASRFRRSDTCGHSASASRNSGSTNSIVLMVGSRVRFGAEQNGMAANVW